MLFPQEIGHLPPVREHRARNAGADGGVRDILPGEPSRAFQTWVKGKPVVEGEDGMKEDEGSEAAASG